MVYKLSQINLDFLLKQVEINTNSIFDICKIESKLKKYYSQID